MTTIAKALIEVRADTSKVGSDVQKSVTPSKTSKWGSVAGKSLALGFTAAAGAAVAGGAFLASAIGKGSDLSETINKSIRIFGKNAASIRGGRSRRHRLRSLA